MAAGHCIRQLAGFAGAPVTNSSSVAVVAGILGQTSDLWAAKSEKIRGRLGSRGSEAAVVAWAGRPRIRASMDFVRADSRRTGQVAGSERARRHRSGQRSQAVVAFGKSTDSESVKLKWV